MSGENFRSNVDRVRAGVDHGECPECGTETKKEETIEKCPSCGWTDRGYQRV